ncbi:MAG: sugar phosphate nucleotidyltransferase [Bacteroidales bacterium]
MKPTLFVLAAGMGSRYGGLKQMDAVGPSGETIMDYSIFDAIRAGFGKVVFVIRKDFEAAFREAFTNRFGGKIEIEIVFQALDKLPQGVSYNTERTKPWGTNHAVMMGAEVIKEPFGVINADDFYGKESFEILAKFLTEAKGENLYSMIGYRLNNTLSESGSVARGVCEKDAEGYLVSVVERTHIEYQNGVPAYKNDDGKFVVFKDPNMPVSMNMWGFTTDYFAHSEKSFKKFLEEQGQNPKSEFFIPYVIDSLIKNKVAKVQVLDTPSKWFGVTYSEDKPTVVKKIAELVEQGVYPLKLWS